MVIVAEHSGCLAGKLKYDSCLLRLVARLVPTCNYRPIFVTTCVLEKLAKAAEARFDQAVREGSIGSGLLSKLP